jgi:hypothetical protein
MNTEGEDIVVLLLEADLILVEEEEVIAEAIQKQGQDQLIEEDDL